VFERSRSWWAREELIDTDGYYLLAGPRGNVQDYKQTNCSRDKPKRHLQKKHHIQVGPNGLPLNPPEDDSPPEPEVKRVANPTFIEGGKLQKALFRRLLLQWMIDAHIAFVQVESPHFHKFLYFLNSAVTGGFCGLVRMRVIYMVLRLALED
jgi:hypothetical protein